MLCYKSYEFNNLVFNQVSKNLMILFWSTKGNTSGTKLHEKVYGDFYKQFGTGHLVVHRSLWSTNGVLE